MITNISTYKLVCDVIETKKVGKEDLLNRLDVFLLAGRLTKDEYNDLVNKIKVAYS